ncbi:MAG: ferritin family protein [Desulfatiglans sp.]|jgi:rubrerythrin|nr:ferritin family protein [Desulfatiglans sp.]
MFSLGEIIDLAIQVEKNGEKTYRKAQKEVKDRNLASVLEWLADDEKAHEKWFHDLKKGINEKIEDVRLEEMGKKILASVLGEQSFSMADADFSRIKDVNALLELSLEFEKDTILFYEMIKAFVDDEKVSAGLDKIIREENAHVKKLEEMI